MSERKAINKYYPPDYDPSKVVRQKKNKNVNQTIKIRMMAPYSMRCLKCNEYIAERRSFNARKETTDEKYLNIKIIRFYITCPGCNNTISFKTNPAEAGYTPEEGAVRNFEPSKKKRKQEETDDELLKRLENEDIEDKKFQLLQKKRQKNPFWKEQDDSKGDVMEKFEKRLIEQQKQQQINEELEAIQRQVELKKEEPLEELITKENSSSSPPSKPTIVEKVIAKESSSSSQQKPTITSKIKLTKKKFMSNLNYSSDSD
ncbi:cwf16 [Candida jiufengensis]|uniref:cwf16 n=1 Tax=Candida jiufengensis TaxID=497108 RepID=UPI0022254733|nr:cwf16 [Candida jiufengensis]KAI5953110.1 cwf16 [Candida jiufengensis]